jgi:cation transport ATPase
VTNKSGKKPTRRFIIVSWWLLFVFITLCLGWISPLGVSNGNPVWGLIMILVFLILQAFFFWRILHNHFPSERNKNLKSALLMFIFVVLGSYILSGVIMYVGLSFADLN